MTNNRMKVVVTDYDYPSLDLKRKVLEEIEPEFVGAHCTTEEEVIAVAKDADGILNEHAPLTKRVIKSLDRCKVICRYGVGKPFFRSRGRVLGLFGLGRIGRAVVRKTKAAQAVLDVLKGGLPKAIVNPQVVK